MSFHQLSWPFLLLSLVPVLICGQDVSSGLSRDCMLACVFFGPTCQHKRGLGLLKGSSSMRPEIEK